MAVVAVVLLAYDGMNLLDLAHLVGAARFVTQSIVFGYGYGDHGDAVLTEAADTRGHTLMSAVCRDWQAATTPAVSAGARVCVLRTAPVMDGSRRRCG